jgi:outer membrane protein OmpA-like peptidoglycan-associated protein
VAVDNESTGLGSSLTDLMTSLAVIFILLLVASHNNEQHKLEEHHGTLADTQAQLERTQRELDDAKWRTNTTRTQILVALRNALESFSAEGVRAETDERDPLGLLVIVPENLLKFAMNEDKIPPGGVDFLRRFTPKLMATVCSQDFANEISAMVIEGHTDSSGPPAINLPLSQRRSMAVVQESLHVLSKPMADAGVPAVPLQCYLDMLSASGRGSSDPLLNADKKEDRERSRRVQFKIRVRSLEQRQG